MLFAISGLAWLDDNADGMRQLSERMLDEWGLVVYRQLSPGQGGRALTTVSAGADGRYVVQLPPAEGYFLSVNYDEFAGRPPIGRTASHFGSTGVLPLMAGGTMLQAHLRLVRREGDRLESFSEQPLDWPIPNGHFFRHPSTPSAISDGFAVTNNDGIPYWDTWRTVGLEVIGAPLSNRFEWDGAIVQVFQGGLLRVAAGKAEVDVLLGHSQEDLDLFPLHVFVPLPLPDFYTIDESRERSLVVRAPTELYSADDALLGLAAPGQRYGIARQERGWALGVEEAGSVDELFWLRLDYRVDFIPL